jgi:hypothetical protein
MRQIPERFHLIKNLSSLLQLCMDHLHDDADVIAITSEILNQAQQELDLSSIEQLIDSYQLLFLEILKRFHPMEVHETASNWCHEHSAAFDAIWTHVETNLTSAIPCKAAPPDSLALATEHRTHATTLKSNLMLFQNHLETMMLKTQLAISECDQAAEIIDSLSLELDFLITLHRQIQTTTQSSVPCPDQGELVPSPTVASQEDDLPHITFTSASVTPTLDGIGWELEEDIEEPVVAPKTAADREARLKQGIERRKKLAEYRSIRAAEDLFLGELRMVIHPRRLN